VKNNTTSSDNDIAMLNIGDKIPDILGVDAAGRELAAAHFAGRGLIIYFYPKDNTSGCTAEACSLRDGWQVLRNMGYDIVGVSKDSPKSHQKFAEKYSLPFPLIADVDHKLAEAFGVWRLKKMAGREYMGMVRTTFVIGPDGIITDVIEKVKTKEASDQLIKLLEGRGCINPA